jgi:hypothetical protein
VSPHPACATSARTALAALLLLSACSSELGRFPTEPEPAPAPIPAEHALLLEKSALAADMVVQLARQVIVIPFPGGALTVGYQNGWYLLRVVMFGSERSLRLQWQDASGAPMPVYDPRRTRAVRILTTTEDRAGLRHFDLIVFGVEAAASELRIQGNGRLVRGGTEWRFFVNGLVLAKLGEAYPLRGTVVLETPHASGETSSVELRFNGSRHVDGVLHSGSVSVYFTLDLVSLRISPREPT